MFDSTKIKIDSIIFILCVLIEEKNNKQISIMPRVLIPVAGLAVRLGGTVKYLLPLFDTDGKVTTLLQEHMRLANALQWNTTVLTRPDARDLTHNYLATFKNTKVFAVCALGTTDTPTTTMSESILLGLEKENRENHDHDVTLMLMGDTYFHVEPKENRLSILCQFVHKMHTLLIENESTVAVLLLFPIRKEQAGKLGQVDYDAQTNDVCNIVDKTVHCPLPYAWGSILYKPKFLDYLNSVDPHIGYAIMPAIRDGMKIKVVVADSCEYYDCGTLHEYAGLLKKN